MSGATEERPWPIFIVSCRRSGATLLRYILDSHERIACPPESKFIAGLPAFLRYPQALQGLSHLGLSKGDLLSELGRFVDSIMRRYVTAKGKVRWADNTPSYHSMLDFIDDIFEGKVHYVYVVRHPLDTVDSLQRATSYSPLTYGDFELQRTTERFGAGRYGYSKFWADVNERLFLFACSRPTRTLTVRYEDLATEPDKTVASVLEFLGEEPSASLVQRAFLEEHDPGFFELNAPRIDGIAPDRIGKWRRWPEIETSSLWTIVGPTAERLGYRRPERSAEPSWAP